MTLEALSKLISSLLKEFKVPVTQTSIFLELEKHPERFSMLGITDVLNRFQVNNGAYRVEERELNSDICPFISHMSRNDGEFVIVKSVKTDTVVISTDSSKKEVLSRDAFKEYFTGAILIIDNEYGKAEQNYKEKKRNEIATLLRTPFLFMSLLLIAVIYVIQNFDQIKLSPLDIISWQLLKITGLIVCVLLIIQILDANNSFVKKLCAPGKKVDCNSILTSKASQITDEFSWSELGLLYFLSTTLILLFYGASVSVLQILAIATILCLPYTVYSITYQYKVAKKWCILCTVVQAIFWLEFLLSVRFLVQPLTIPTLKETMGMLILLIVPLASWVSIKPLLISSRQISSVKSQLNTFKSNADLFRTVLVSQQRIGIPDDDFAISVGSQTPEKIITIVSSPTCAPCAKAHKVLENWLASDETLQVRIVYALFNESKEGINYRVASHITSLQLAKSVELNVALHEWYRQDQKDYDGWIKTHPIRNNQEVDMLLEKHVAWCSAAGINTTPTIYVNGYKLPEPYRLEDIRYLI